jgi:hypothetical protein
MTRVKGGRALAARHGARRNVIGNCAPRWCRTAARRWRQRGLSVPPVLGELLLMFALAMWLLWASDVG